MVDPLPMVELRLQLQPDKIEQYIRRQLHTMFNEGQIRQKLVKSILEHSDGYLALARLSVDDLTMTSNRFATPVIRDRLGLSHMRFFNLALQRVKIQNPERDRDLGLAVLALVGLAGLGEDMLSFGALKGALMLIQASTNRFGLPLRMDQNWAAIKNFGRLPTRCMLYTCSPEVHL
jgi:hypothetical protein